MLDMFEYPFDPKQSDHAREYEWSEFQLLVLVIRQWKIITADMPRLQAMQFVTGQGLEHLRFARHRAIDAAYEISRVDPPLHEYLRYCDRASEMAKAYFHGREFVKAQYRHPEGV